MSNRASVIIFSVGLLVTLVGCGAEAAPILASEPPAPPPATGAIVLADISDEPVKKIKRFQPLADYLASHLSEFDIGVGEVKIAPDRETMASWLASGEVDLYFDSPFPAMVVSNQSGALPILRRWKGGDAEYYSVFFARTDSDLVSLDDLKGQVIAFEEPNSTSGFMLPMVHLLKAGLNPVEKRGLDAHPAEDEVGYVFSRDDESTIQWVITGRVVAGVTDSRSFRKLSEETRSTFNVISETEAVARQVVVVHPNMDSALLDTIESLLVDMDETNEGRAVLDKFKTTQFDAFPAGDATLARMREMYQRVQSK